ncbi:hypothetical protein M2116_000126 [Aurantimicrobium minutum]|uniref:DUF3800 domain-containing protein n=1 Tax=Aurantimicrobium minutum TaxID=708131 RepID=UPI00240620CE|nr:DUF3800 domain-containing protein [Aurantimicrobium minutum]MDF9809192.1 hypothetical protein [Aurantimicrobium minutum]
MRGLSRIYKGNFIYIGYFDEFGHNGAYISRNDVSFKTHPVFGLGGFVIPAESVRDFSKEFKWLKHQYLKDEIAAKVTSVGKNLNHWEKKGSSLLTTQNIEKYPEVRRLIGRVLKKLDEFGGQVYFYGQEKDKGPTNLISETNSERYDHVMKQLIQRLDRDLPLGSSLLMILDEQGDRERLEVYAGSASFMFTNPSGIRLIEPPMQVESHLYQTVQAADWICALLGRIAAYKYDEGFEEYKWASKYFGNQLAKMTSKSSKIRGLSGNANDKANLFPQYLGTLNRCFGNFQSPVSQNQMKQLLTRYSRTSP